VVVNGAGAAGLSCIALIKQLGVPHENVIACDRMLGAGRKEYP